MRTDPRTAPVLLTSPNTNSCGSAVLLRVLAQFSICFVEKKEA